MTATKKGSAWPAGLLVLLAALACEKASEPAVEPPQETDPQRVVLARVGDEVIRVEDLGFVPARANLGIKLETLVLRKLAAEEARRRGLADDPKVREKLAQFRNSAVMWEEGLLRNTLYNSIRLGLTLSEVELRNYFDQTRSRYTEPQWKLRLQRFGSEAEARAAAQKLGATGRLDPAQSESLGPAPAEQLPPALLGALPLLKQPGDRQVLDLSGSWSVVELEEHLPNAPVSFEAARARVDQDLRAQRAEAILNGELVRLRAEQVTIDQAALNQLQEERAGQIAERRARQANQGVLPGAVPEPPPPTPDPGAPDSPALAPPGAPAEPAPGDTP